MSQHIEVIDFQEFYGWIICAFCGKEAPNKWGIPTLDGRIVPHDWQGEWGNSPACYECFCKNEVRNMDYQRAKEGRPYF